MSVALTVVLASSAAWAGGGATDEVACGTSPYSGWNAPNGAVVLSSSGNGGVIAPVISAIGEYYQHSMISHGSIGWMTHNTMHTPGTNDVCEACDNPLRTADLQTGYPGYSQTNSGGIYQYNHSAVYMKYQRSSVCSGDTGRDATVANWLWSSSKYYYTASKQGTQGIYRIKWNDNSDYIHYYLYAYRNLGNSYLGGNYRTDSANANRGNHCSGTIGWAQASALGTSWKIAPGTPAGDYASYNSTQLKTAANALQAGVKDSCSDGNGFWGNFAAGFACFFCDFDTNVCDDAGRQVGYCMMYGYGNCHRGGDSWSVPSNLTAVSISPDRVGGWSGHPWSGACSANNNEGVWAYDGGAQVQWNSGGQVYGCWF